MAGAQGGRLAAPVRLFYRHGYLYELRDTGFVLWSSGPDKQLGNADDIWYDWPARTDTIRVVER
jgi:hypothetical protein